MRNLVIASLALAMLILIVQIGARTIRVPVETQPCPGASLKGLQCLKLRPVSP